MNILSIVLLRVTTLQQQFSGSTRQAPKCGVEMTLSHVHLRYMKDGVVVVGAALNADHVAARPFAAFFLALVAVLQAASLIAVCVFVVLSIGTDVATL